MNPKKTKWAEFDQCQILHMQRMAAMQPVTAASTTPAECWLRAAIAFDTGKLQSIRFAVPEVCNQLNSIQTPCPFIA